MATLSLHIDLDNDALVDNPHAVADLVETVARQVRNGYTSGYPRDANGNGVGYWSLDTDQPRE